MRRVWTALSARLQGEEQIMRMLGFLYRYMFKPKSLQTIYRFSSRILWAEGPQRSRIVAVRDGFAHEELQRRCEVVVSIDGHLLNFLGACRLFLSSVFSLPLPFLGIFS